MKKIPLSKRDVFAIIDNEFYETASQFRWYLNIISGRNYVCRNVKISVWRYRKELLHRAVWTYYHGELPPRAKITFVDNNSLNCQIRNLRITGITNESDGKAKMPVATFGHKKAVVK